MAHLALENYFITNLQTIDKFDKNDKSSLKLCGRDIFKLNDNSLADFRNNEIGFIFQFHQLLPEFTLIENICLPAYIKNKKSIAEEKAMELINYLNLEKIIQINLMNYQVVKTKSSCCKSID